ncbi:hypothetical protein BpHYR1_013138 [Brachionus plicatilis]|uniref:Uncharacterized protein n=1 Tax=Brachionus plicatilis TaxID=10195 RepID=A0A3M7Q9L3_BRAPC|nr:hypothetical protein BpHYR1_013138 [Brachionus plicatilis]
MVLMHSSFSSGSWALFAWSILTWLLFGDSSGIVSPMVNSAFLKSFLTGLHLLNKGSVSLGSS